MPLNTDGLLHHDITMYCESRIPRGCSVCFMCDNVFEDSELVEYNGRYYCDRCLDIEHDNEAYERMVRENE